MSGQRCNRGGCGIPIEEGGICNGSCTKQDPFEQAILSSGMTPTDRQRGNQRIAELEGLRVLGLANCVQNQDGCGWYVVGDNKPSESTTEHLVYADPAYDGHECPGEAMVQDTPACWCVGVPDYFTDLTACRRAAGKLPEGNRVVFMRSLLKVVRGNGCSCVSALGMSCGCNDCIFNLILAPPESICAAILSALGVE